LASLEGLGYVVDYFDRGSYRREDPVEVARLRAREDARTLLIARDMPILRNAETGLDPLLPMREIEALGGAQVEAFWALRRTARQFSSACCLMRPSNSVRTPATAFSIGGFWSCPAAKT